MKTHVLYKMLATLLLIAALPSAEAASRKINLNLEDAMKRMDLAETLAEKSIAFYWADQIPSRLIEKEIATDTYSRGANATLKSDLRACSNAFENIIETLIEDAEQFGANAIIGIRSYHDELPDFSSETEYRCDVGAFRASVGFRVRFVRLAP
jgi:uncharacterized protein YbjQ (UPF0145 family)